MNVRARTFAHHDSSPELLSLVVNPGPEQRVTARFRADREDFRIHHVRAARLKFGEDVELAFLGPFIDGDPKMGFASEKPAVVPIPKDFAK